MSMATTWWRRRHRRKDPLDEADDSLPLDTQEQEEMVRSFERKHAQQSLLWRRVIAGILLCYAGFMMYCIFNQAWSPWELRFHAYFMEEMHPGMPILFDLVAIVACLLAVKGLLQSSGSVKFFWYSTYASLMVAIFWIFYMLNFPRFRWDVVWLPLAPLGGAALCFYLEHLLSESVEDINKLRTYMYNYKAL